MRFRTRTLPILALLALAACRSPHPVAALNEATAPATIPMNADFAKYCANPTAYGNDVQFMIMGIRTGPQEVNILETATGGIQELSTSGSCQTAWDRFVKTPKVDFPVLGDLAPIRMIKDVPNVDFDISFTSMPLHFEVILELQLKRLAIRPNSVTFASVSAADRAKILSVISQMTGLAWLGIDGLGFTDFSPLKPLVNLESFSCANNAVSDLSFLSGWSHLQQFAGYDNQIEDLAPLANLLEIISIDLTKNRVKTLDTLLSLANLETLSLNDNPTIEEILALQYLPNLRRLDIERAGVKNIAALKDLPLEHLDLIDNPVESLEPLRNLPLKQLFLRGTKVTDLDPVKDMPKLVQLNVGGLAVKTFPKIGPDAALSTLDLQGTQITNLCNALASHRLINFRTPGGAIWKKNLIDANRCPEL